MTETRINLYEAMFLFPQTATADLGGALAHVESILGRSDAEIVSLCKWDERRLAYDIKGNKRGLYFLVYFKADRSKIAGIERDCNLSEQLLRTMVVRADHIPAEEIEAADGRTALADEIKLRAERGEDEARPKVTAVSLEEEAAAKEAAAKEAAKEATATATADAEGEGDDSSESKDGDA